MRNFRLLIAYDGTDFSGWQRQPDRATIQGQTEMALERILGSAVTVIGAGRTDAKVHASGQVANFFTAKTIPCSNLRKALNDVLPAAIRILKVEEATPQFHARYDARVKVYRYRIFQGPVCPPFLARFVHRLPRKLDAARMDEAARLIEGRHDFTSFAAADPEGSKCRTDRTATCEKSRVRCIYSSHVVWRPRTSLLVYEVRGDGFLRHMVRNIAGTLIEVGAGQREPGDIRRVLAARDRAAAGFTAPANGLCLVRVDYE